MHIKKIHWLFLAATLYWIGLYTYAPILPGYVKGIVGDLRITGAILSMYGLLQIVFRFPLGVASDLTGKRRVFSIFGLLALGIGPLLLAAAASSRDLFIGRAITGVAASTWVPLSALILKESRQDIFRSTATLSFISGLGSIFGVAATPLLISTAWGFRPAFFAASVAAVLAITIILFIKEEKMDLAERIGKRNILSAVAKPLILIPGVLCALVQLGNFATTFTFIPLIGQQVGLSDASLSLIMNIYLIITMVINLLLTRILRRVNQVSLSLVAFFILSVGMVACGFAGSFFTLLLSQSVIGLAFGIAYPLFMGMSANHSDSRSIAIALGSFQSLYSIGMAAGPRFSTSLAAWIGQRPMFILLALIVFLMGSGFTFWYKRIAN
jgi:MFS family permease